MPKFNYRYQISIVDCHKWRILSSQRPVNFGSSLFTRVYVQEHRTVDPKVEGSSPFGIEVDNYIIDITADQFNEEDSQFQKVIVCKVDNSKWHYRWEKPPSTDSSFDGFLKYDEIAIRDNKVKYTDLYNMVCEKIRSAISRL